MTLSASYSLVAEAARRVTATQGGESKLKRLWRPV